MNSTQNHPVKRPITKEDWKLMEKKLEDFYDSVTLICDGYELTCMLRRVTTHRNAICIYVNGVIEGRWYLEDCEERRRFFRPLPKKLYSEKELLAWKKISVKEYKERLDRNKYFLYTSHWTNFKALKCHLIKQNKVIEWVDRSEKGTHDEDKD